MKDLLQGLNTPQIDAVKAFRGPYLVIAGAGSGKTTALTRRIAYLIREHSVSPYNILAMTFTNKAAGEMRTRVSDLICADYANPLIGTFHSVCVRILREEIQHFGYEQNFTILDQHDQLVLVKRVTKELELPKQQFAPRAILEAISRAKNNLMSPEMFSGQVGSYFEEQVARVYDVYQRTLRENHSVDFDDIIRLSINLFKEYPNVLKKYQERFQYVLVDEYQDTNHAQYTFIKMLTDMQHNLFVVGDDWQSIYRWRGADVNNILNFEKDFPNAKVIKLEQNYRSTQNILDAAYNVIKHNESRSKKEIWTDAGAGNVLTVYEAYDEREEAMFVVQTIQKLFEKGYIENDFVVLYRTNAQSRIVEEYFLKNNISYRIVGGIKFYERKEIKDVIAYLRLVANGADVLSLERAVASPRRGIGSKTFAAWFDAARAVGMDPIAFGASAKIKNSTLAKSKQKTIHDFCVLIENARTYAKKHTLDELITDVYEKSGYKSELLDGTTEGEARDENVQELLSVATKYKDIDNALNMFIEEVSLASDTDHINQNTNMVHLMTLHSAKGLEFPVVFIVGLEEGLIPHNRAMVNDVEMEEERRLAYVGITRAKDKVFLTHARQRLLFGSLQANMPSRFFEDIPDFLIEKKETTIPRKQYGDAIEEKPESVLVPTEEKFVGGDKVRHAIFGEGIVVGQTDTVVYIVFKNVGLKKIVKSIAPLEKII
ncbi:MAG: ATP-dependent DNA helicase PcrA [Candidatus Moraniibacteriota bacterium]|nr:MAG: ATP-dependent DNA helicase PcrA [Candidatus Moranbacteria bacterium]